MRLYRIPDNRAGGILLGFFLFALLLLSRDTLVVSSLIGFYLSQLIMLGLIVAVGIVFLVWNRNNLKVLFRDQRMLMVTLFTVIIVLPMLVKQDWQVMYLSVLLCIYVAVFFTYFTTFEKVAYYYVGILSGLAVFSLFALFVLKPMADSGMLNVPVFQNSAGLPFYNFGLCYAVAQPNYLRNFGIFREPGVYQFFIILALYLNNYALNWKKPWKMWLVNAILAATMLSTFSINGVLQLALLAVVVFVDRKLYKDRRIVVAVAIVLVVLLAVLGFVIAQQGTLYWTLYSMVEKLYTLNESASSRIEAIYVDIMFFLNNPLWGERIYDVMYAVDHNTTSSLLIFSIFGVTGGVLSVVSWVVLVWDKNRHAVVNLALLAILFLSFNTQNLIADVFFWLFPIMALIQLVYPKLKFSGPDKRSQ